MTSTRRLAVVLYDRLVGYLERQGTADPTFTYDPDYAATGRVPLSTRLPLTEETYPAAKVAPYLNGLLPENPDTRQQWARTLGTTPDDPYEILAVMGWDCPGAVQFASFDALDDLAANAAAYEPVDSGYIAERLARLVEEPASWTMPGEHWSLGGQQEKFTLALREGTWCEAHGAAATTHIFKPGIRVLLHQALVEHVTMRAAALVGVDVAETRMLRFQDHWAIVIGRYDRFVPDTEDGTSSSPAATVARLHQEDFCQATGRLPARKYESNGGPTLADMAKLVDRQMTNPKEDLLALADFALINLVAGAPDGHSKNISLLLEPDGTRRVAPLYDLATGLAYDSSNVERQVAVSVGGERLFSRVRARQYEKAAKTLAVPTALLQARAGMLAAQFPAAFAAALEEVAEIPGADQIADRTTANLEAHCARLLAQMS